MNKYRNAVAGLTLAVAGCVASLGLIGSAAARPPGGVPDGFKPARTGNFTSKKNGWVFRGFNPAVVGDKCVAKPDIHKAEWGAGVYKKYLYEWDAEHKNDGVTKCTGGRVMQYQSGWTTTMPNMFIVRGRAYTKSEWF